MNMPLEVYKEMYDPSESLPGWEAIDSRLQMVYGDLQPSCFTPEKFYHEGGENPLYAINMFRNLQQDTHYHLVSYGMTDLFYNETYLHNEFSKWGFEFTMRVHPKDIDSTSPNWVINLMNNLARHVYQTQRHFEPYHFVDAEGPIKQGAKTDICGLVFDIDPEMSQILTPHGKVHFLQMIGINSKQLNRIYDKPEEDTVKQIIDEIKQSNPLMLTSL